MTPLLGVKAAQGMRLVTVNSDMMERVAAVSVESLLDNYSDVFDRNLGTLPGLTTLQLKPDAVPVIMPDRRVPISIRPHLKKELDCLCDMGVIEPIEEPTPWVSQLVTPKKKSGDMRICLDLHELNKSLMREHYTMPILEDVLHEMKDAKVFSKADLSPGYWHVKLDNESSKITTFQTGFGRYKWCRLAFGLKSAAEIFQKKMLKIFRDLPGVTV